MLSESDLLTSLSIEASHNQLAVLRIGEYQIPFGFSDRACLEYVKRVYFPYEIIVPVISQPVEIEIIRDSSSRRYKEVFSSITKQDIDTFVGGNEHINILRHGVYPTVYNISNSPEIGASCLLRRILLRLYKMDYPDLLFFHAASIVNQQGEMIVFASPGIDGENKGKTTAMLACVARKGSTYSFLSSDDVILVPVTTGYNFLPFPTEINVSNKTLSIIQKEEIALQLELYSYRSLAGITRMTTAWGIFASGFKVATTFTKIKSWIFIDLKPSCSNYDITEIEGGNEFIESLSRQRLALLDKPLVNGEQAQFNSSSFVLSKEVNDRVMKLFKQLKSDGTQFLTLKGGIDRTKLATVIAGI